ncbi:MAG TPA: hypothetical protein VJ836_07290 [Candidatus Saccharimonadales bacterium]|nr:hypothetical protein [Candidatus Saccharimonadales bacterium]
MTKSRKIVIAGILLAAVLLTAWALYVTQGYDGPQTTSKSKTAQRDYSDGAPRESNQSGRPQGGAIDTGGADAGTETEGVSSTSGAITVARPAKGALVTPGAILSGMVKDVDAVQYRLIDDQQGVIAQGQLQVADGTFSGKLQFSARAATGRLDVFSFDPTGREVNYIEMPVRFKE